MKRALPIVAILVLVVGGLVPFVATRAGAQTLQPQIAVQDACKVATAAVTKAWNPTSPVVRAESDPPYGNAACSKFVADFDVPTLTPLGGQTTNFTINPGLHWTNQLLQLDATACPTLVVDAVIYRRAVRSNELVRIGGGRKRGQLHNGTCTLVNDANWVQPPSQTPPQSGTARYRVAESAKLGDQVLPVEIILHRPY